jgi:hypothetical protein
MVESDLLLDTLELAAIINNNEYQELIEEYIFSK